MITGLLQLGAVQVVDRRTEEVIGYAYTVQTETGQLQRWLLYRDPQNAFDLTPPPPTMSECTLAYWQAKVSELWQPDSFYVWAQADVYDHGGKYGGEAWTQIPPASRLPPATFPPVDRGSYQLDPTGVRLLLVRQGSLRGLAYSVGGLKDASSIEYWMLPQNYAPAGVQTKTEVADGDTEASSLQTFVDTANKSWGPGCALAITGCINYTGKAPPATP